MNCVSCDIVIYACTASGLCFFPGIFLSSRVTGACPVTTDFIMRVNVRTTTTTTTITGIQSIRDQIAVLRVLLIYQHAGVKSESNQSQRVKVRTRSATNNLVVLVQQKVAPF